MYFTCTHHPAGQCSATTNVGVWITSGQSPHVIRQCLEKVQNMLPPHAFGGRGPKTGPHIFMTDDDSGQRGALLDTWKEVIIQSSVLSTSRKLSGVGYITPATT